MLKKCLKCEEEKTPDNYARSRREKDGLQKYCKVCHNEMKIKGQQRIKAQDVEAYKARRSADSRRHDKKGREEFPIWRWASQSVRGARKRAKVRQIECTITQAYLNEIAPTTCPLLDIELQYVSVDGKKSDGSATVDRIFPERGYIEGNVQVISDKANRAKSNASIDEMKLVLSWMRLATNVNERRCKLLDD